VGGRGGRIRELGRPLAGKALGLAAFVSVLIGGRWIAFSVQDLGTPVKSARSTGHDALWLSHLWVDGREGPAGVAALAARLRGTGIRDLFVHVGPLAAAGTLDPGLRPRARWFAGAVHQALPGIRVQAWIGDTVPPAGSLDVEDASTRLRISESAASAMADGFDGIHLDLEPVGDADPGYLALLDAVRPVVHAAGGLLSVSAEQVEPVTGGRWAMEAAIGHGTWWSAAYLRQVAERVDQVAVMSYDTALWSASAYSGFVRAETAAALAAVPARVALFMGVPAYRAAGGTGPDLGHVDSAETVGAAIRGVRLGLSSAGSPGAGPHERAFGIALYLDYTATPADWAAYRSDWLGSDIEGR
jgi:hypothetical protein